ncbi:MAG: hypothetical protein IJM23_10550 [Lachnospiraceae bacterium]|nr:hypothetical protein [Lachnospiraceae bacterium]
MALFDFLKSSTDKRLDEMVERVKLNYSNNYHDDAVRSYEALETAFDNLSRNNKLNDKQIDYYNGVMKDYKEKIDKMANDRTAYWAK